VKKILKSVKIWQSDGHESVAPLLAHPVYTGWQWRNFVPYLCQLVFAAILWVKCLLTLLSLKYALVSQSVLLFLNHPRSEGWLNGHTMDVFSSFISVILIDSSMGVLSTCWCCPSRPCVIFLACVHLSLFLALPLSQGNSLIVSSWRDHTRAKML